MIGRWFTNSKDPKADAADWSRWSGSVIAIGDPMVTADSAPLEQLKKWGMRGLYEVSPGHRPLPTDPPR